MDRYPASLSGYGSASCLLFGFIYTYAETSASP
jgi:hypothetical protein